MLVADLKQWLDREESPSDFYQLVGQPRLCRNRELLLGCLEEANEFLFQYQNHKDKRVRDRARTLSRQLADARRTLADESRWEQYDADLIARLHEMYRNNPSFSGPNPKLEDLKRWLALVQQVDPDRVEELVESWRNASRTPETEPELKSASPQEEMESPGTSKPPIPPPPPHRNGNGRMNGRGKTLPPPPPKDAPRQPRPPVRSNSRPAAPGTRDTVAYPRQAGETPGSPVLWIAMAAFVTALVLGLFGLVIAWGAGAFDGNRMRGAIPSESSFVFRQPPSIVPELGLTGTGSGCENSRDFSSRRFV